VASVIRQLSDDDREAVHHLIRRDALSDLDIARAVEKRLGRQIAAGDKAKTAVIYRYRRGREYGRWLARWENQDAELRRAVELQKQRFEYLSSLVQGQGEKGLYEASNHLKARLLTIAAELSDAELKTGDVKWIKSLLREIREAEKMDRASLAAKAEDVAGDSKLDEAERRRRIREIFKVGEKA
jgi:hypothetical protein